MELYEFRLGSSWGGAIFLAALRSPNYSLYGVKPGTHTFFLNTLSNNGQYGDTPASAEATLIDPPDNWSVTNTETCDYSGVDIEGMTAANPCVVTWTGHGLNDDSKVTFEDIAQANWTALNSNAYAITVLTSDTFSIAVDASTFGSYVPGTDPGKVYIGEHDNTEYYSYGGDDTAKCSHTGDVLVGTYTSPVFDRGSSGRYLIYCLAEILVIGSGTTWADQFPSPTTWADQNVTTLKWREIFELNAAPSVQIALLYGDTSPPTNRVEKLELLSCIATGRYFQVEITITDPLLTINALVKDFTLKFCQGA